MSFLLVKFAVCKGEALCLYNEHKQGAENVNVWLDSYCSYLYLFLQGRGSRGGFLHSFLEEMSQTSVFCESLSLKQPPCPRTR